MYLEHFGFHRLPFTIAPDPELLFPSHGHQEALAHLNYALTGHGGLVCLTGEVGTGKTTLCRAFLGGLPSNVRSAYLFNPNVSATELLHSLCDEFSVPVPAGASLRDLYHLLNHELLKGYAAGQRFICVIDEAQSMPVPLLEQVRLLTNLETNKEKLLTLILVGQPELRELLARYDLRQLSQRITARYHLRHLGLPETRAYLNFRCRQAGVERPLFSAAAIWHLWRSSGGIPRLLNTLADRALLGAYALGRQRVGVALVRGAQREILPPSRWFRSGWLALALLLLVVWLLPRPENLHLPDWRGFSMSSDFTAPIISGPVALLTQALSLTPQDDCRELAVSGWQCLWLDWPVSRLQALPLPVAIQVAEPAGLQWRLLSDVSPLQRTAGPALVLWQGPADYRQQLIRPGQRDEVVGWVRTRLQQEWPEEWQVIGPQGQANRPDPAFYDPLLAQAVEAFQRQNDLSADRVLGPQTLMMLWLKER